MSTHASDPGDVLFGYTRRRVLAWLYGHPDERFFLREVSRRAGVALGAVQRELQLLVGAGLVTRRDEGRQAYFQANRSSPVFPELERLVMKTAGAAQVLREALDPLASSIAVSWIFGSVAKGAAGPSSDIDLMVIGEVPFVEVVGALSQAQVRLGREVNPTVYPPAEFRQKLRAGHHFLTSVLEEPKEFVIGGSHELGKVAGAGPGPRPQDQRKRNQRPPRYRRS